MAEDVPFSAERGPFAGQEGHLDAPFWATPEPIVERMLDLAGVGPGDRLVDLGCGDGRIVISAALRGAEAMGVDRDPVRLQECAAAARLAGVEDRVRFEQGDLFRTPLGDASVVTLYLLPHVNRMLAGKLRSELSPGARVVAHAYALPGWTPAVRQEADGRICYLWVR